MFGEMIRFFARHRTAANLLMVLMIAIGGLSAARLNKQFFPDVDIEIVAVSVEWSGATAEDVDANIVRTLEPELRTLANVKTVMSTSFEGSPALMWNLNLARICKKRWPMWRQRSGGCVCRWRPRPRISSRANSMM